MNHLPASSPAFGLLRNLGYGLAQIVLFGAWLTGRLSAWQQGVRGAAPAAALSSPAAQ